MNRIQIEQQKGKRDKEKVHIKMGYEHSADSSQKVGCHIFENYMKTNRRGIS